MFRPKADPAFVSLEFGQALPRVQKEYRSKDGERYVLYESHAWLRRRNSSDAERQLLESSA